MLALEIGVDTLEMDVVVTRDEQVVVSHEPWFRSQICSNPQGARIPSWREREHNIYAMTYEEVARYRCGVFGDRRFPEQEHRSVQKPLLADVIAACEEYAGKLGRSAPFYSVEIKSRPRFDGRFHPPPAEYSRLLLDVFSSKDVIDRAIVQSFDVRSLRATRTQDESIPLALLVDNRRGYRWNVGRLGFLPELYSPNHTRMTKDDIERAHQDLAAVIPWTVNDPCRMRTLLEMGINGFITDYPDTGREVIQAFLRESTG